MPSSVGRGEPADDTELLSAFHHLIRGATTARCLCNLRQGNSAFTASLHPATAAFTHAMPRDGKLSVEVLVGGEPLEEYDKDGKCYVEMDLQHATSYDCDYEDETPHGLERSTWPVTPFQVKPP